MFLDNLSSEFVRFKTSLDYNLPLMLKILAGLWLLNIVNWSFRSKLNFLGIKPRNIPSLPGIVFSTFLHANFNHLFFNSIPFFCLGLFIMSFGLKFYFLISLLIILIEGTLTWLFGRRGNHIGASGLISGYFGLIIIQAYKVPSLTTIVLAIITLYYFGSILLSFFPTKEQVSWESHLFGFIAGIASLYILKFI